MGMNPHCQDITITFDCQFEVFLKAVLSHLAELQKDVSI